MFNFTKFLTFIHNDLIDPISVSITMANTAILCISSLMLLMLSVQAAQNSSHIICAFYEGSIEHVDEDEPEVDVTEPSATTTVPKQVFKKCDSSYCYTFWQLDAKNETIVMGQGNCNLIIIILPNII